VNPNIMGCSKGPYGKCTRCGIAHPSYRASQESGPKGVPTAQEKAIKEARRKERAYQVKMEEIFGAA